MRAWLCRAFLTVDFSQLIVFSGVQEGYAVFVINGFH
jgi:hypothetical protein